MSFTTHGPGRRSAVLLRENANARETNASTPTRSPPRRVTVDFPGSSQDPKARARAARKHTLHGSGPSLIGRIGIGVAATAVILGGIVGGPGLVGISNDQPVAVSTVHRSANSIGAISDAQREPGTLVADALGHAEHVLKPLGLDRETALSSLRSISFSVTLDTAHVLTRSESAALHVNPGTRVSASMSDWGVSIRIDPALEWRAEWAPDAKIHAMRYDFASGKFDVDASGFGPDGIYSRSITKKANEFLKTMLPEAMQRPGYHPWRDANIQKNLQSLIDLFQSSNVDPDTGTARSRSTSDYFATASRPTLAMTFSVPSTQKTTFGEYVATIEAGTGLDVSIQLDGHLNKPKLGHLRIGFRTPVTVHPVGKESSTLKKAEFHSITLLPGGKVTAEYDLAPEQMVDGFKALVTLLAVMAEPRANIPNIERTRLEGVRQEIDAKLEKELGQVLKNFLEGHDFHLPGVSLSEILGLEQP